MAQTKTSPISKFYEDHDKLQAAFEAEYLRPGRRGRPRKNKMYFTPVTEAAIVAYNIDEDRKKRNRIYKEHIHYPLYKMAENLIHRFKFYYMDGSPEDVKYEVISFLLEKLNKYTPDKGRAFSYFSIVAKNYLILHNNNNYKKLKQTDDESVTDYKRDALWETKREDILEGKKEYMDLFVEYWSNNLTTVFKRKQDIDVANSVLYLMEQRQNIENFNKKALYILIREMTGSNTQHITRVINVLKKHHANLQKNYLATGSIETKWTGSWDNL